MNEDDESFESEADEEILEMDILNKRARHEEEENEEYGDENDMNMLDDSVESD